MRVFLTGATGYIGSVIAEQLIEAGHHVIGLARSDDSAVALTAEGIEALRGDLSDAEALIAASAAADGVVHTGFRFDEKSFAASMAGERRAVRALIMGLGNTGKPFVATSGTGMLGDTGTTVLDEDAAVLPEAHDGVASFGSEMVKATRERLGMEQDVLKAAGVKGIVVRPPSVYGRSDGRSLLNALRSAGRTLGAVPYVSGSGSHKWTFVHVDDLAQLYVLSLNSANRGELFHAGAQSGLQTRAIARAVAQGLGLEGRIVELGPSEAAEALGPFMSAYWATNSQSSSEKARRLLGWQPRHMDMLAELARPQTDQPAQH